MKVHILQHVEFEGPGSIGLWLNERQATTTYTRFFGPSPLPLPGSADLIVVMGGPMSANDDQKFPWLVSEKQFIREAIAGNVPVLGICLGAQLIAAAKGASIYPNREREIGWFPLQAGSMPAGIFQFPQKFQAFHWHGETFDLPEGAVRLAESEACQNQAFQLDRHVIALQFHLETTKESASSLLANSRGDLVPGPYVQTETQLQAAPESGYAAINKIMDSVLSYLTRNTRIA